MEKRDLMIGNRQDTDTLLTWQELCDICNIPPDVLDDLIAWEIVHPQKMVQGQSQFDINALFRIRIALRLQHDLEVNWSGVALVLELMDELKTLREQARLRDRHFWYR